MFSNFSFENLAVYEIMWKNMVEPDRPQMTRLHTHRQTDRQTHTHTHTKHVMLIAFPQQQWLRERA
jgi:hypothetical protein